MAQRAAVRVIIFKYNARVSIRRHTVVSLSREPLALCVPSNRLSNMNENILISESLSFYNPYHY